MLQGLEQSWGIGRAAELWLPRGFVWCHGQDLSPWLGAFFGTECPGLHFEPLRSWTNAFLQNSPAGAEPGVVLFTNNPSLQMPYTVGHLGLEVFWHPSVTISGSAGAGERWQRLLLRCCLGSRSADKVQQPAQPAFCWHLCGEGSACLVSWTSRDHVCVNQPWEPWNSSQHHSPIFENLDFNLCFSCLCVKQRFSVCSRQRDLELAPWAAEFSTDFLWLFLGEIIAAVVGKTWKSFMQIVDFYHIS